MTRYRHLHQATSCMKSRRRDQRKANPSVGTVIDLIAAKAHRPLQSQRPIDGYLQAMSARPLRLAHDTVLLASSANRFAPEEGLVSLPDMHRHRALAHIGMQVDRLAALQPLPLQPVEMLDHPLLAGTDGEERKAVIPQRSGKGAHQLLDLLQPLAPFQRHRDLQRIRWR